MRDKKFIIADGHHRYETALEYRRRLREQPGGFKGDCDYVMMFLTPIESPGLTVLPFHRLLEIENPESAVDKLKRAFDISEHPVSESASKSCEDINRRLDQAPAASAAFVFYPGGDKYCILNMRENFDSSSFTRAGTSSEVAELDVTVLHQVVIQGLLGLDEQRMVQEGGVSFLSRPEDAFEAAAEKKDRAAFFIRPTRIEQVWSIALSGQKMPQKSTNFYPKLTTGLVINEL